MRVFAAVLLALLLAGCAGGAATRPAPAWVTTPPGEDKDFMYFTSSGSSPEGDQVKAEEIARGALIDSIMQYLGAKITAETTSTARAALDSFQSDVRQQITQTSSGRISGLSLADTWVDRQKARTSVYLLAKFAKADLAREKKRIEAVFQEQVAAVSGPENEAKGLEDEGRHYEAAVKYIEAAAAAAKSDIDNAKIKFERNINQAKAALDRISLVKLNDNLKTAAGKGFAEPFRVKVVTGSMASDPGVPDASLAATYVEIRSGSKQVRTVPVKAGGDGVASVHVPRARVRRIREAHRGPRPGSVPGDAAGPVAGRPAEGPAAARRARHGRRAGGPRGKEEGRVQPRGDLAGTGGLHIHRRGFPGPAGRSRRLERFQRGHPEGAHGRPVQGAHDRDGAGPHRGQERPRGRGGRGSAGRGMRRA